MNIRNMPEELAIRVRVVAALRGVRIRDIVIAAIEAYLKDIGGRGGD